MQKLKIKILENSKFEEKLNEIEMNLSKSSVKAFAFLDDNKNIKVVFRKGQVTDKVV